MSIPKQIESLIYDKKIKSSVKHVKQQNSEMCSLLIAWQGFSFKCSDIKELIFDNLELMKKKTEDSFSEFCALSDTSHS